MLRRLPGGPPCPRSDCNSNSRSTLVGFAGAVAAWNDLERFDNKTTVLTGGAGFRYEPARRHGLHIGLDAAFGPAGPRRLRAIRKRLDAALTPSRTRSDVVAAAFRIPLSPPPYPRRTACDP